MTAQRNPSMEATPLGRLRDRRAGQESAVRPPSLSVPNHAFMAGVEMAEALTLHTGSPLTP
jgi:hypothetical protein